MDAYLERCFFERGVQHVNLHSGMSTVAAITEEMNSNVQDQSSYRSGASSKTSSYAK